MAQACPDGVDTLINNAGTLGSYDLASETCARLPSVHMLHMLLACLRRRRSPGCSASLTHLDS